MQVWINDDDSTSLAAIAKALSATVKANEAKQLRAFIIVLTDKDKAEKTASSLEKVAKDLNVSNIGIAYLARDDGGVRGYKINTDASVKNTILVYKNKRVTTKFVNLVADKAGLKQLETGISSLMTE